MQRKGKTGDILVSCLFVVLLSLVCFCPRNVPALILDGCLLNWMVVCLNWTFACLHPVVCVVLTFSTRWLLGKLDDLFLTESACVLISLDPIKMFHNFFVFRVLQVCPLQ